MKKTRILNFFMTSSFLLNIFLLLEVVLYFAFFPFYRKLLGFSLILWSFLIKILRSFNRSLVYRLATLIPLINYIYQGKFPSYSLLLIKTIHINKNQINGRDIAVFTHYYNHFSLGYKYILNIVISELISLSF